VVVWSPAFVFAAVTWPMQANTPVLEGLFVGGMGYVFLTAGLYAVLRPQRGVPDIIAGTYLVPR
jgi:hypothetical protein